MQIKAQSAIEFLSTYSFSFLLIAIIMTILLLFSSLPKTTLPLQCSFYGGFSCLYTAFYNTASPNANSKASIVEVVASDTEPGVMNVSNFSTTINNAQNISGYCEPRLLTAGSKVYCFSLFPSAVKLGSIYTTTFKIGVKYCASSPNMISNSSCPSPTPLIFGGTASVQSSNTPAPVLVIVNEFHILITNKQNNATPSQFQQMIAFPPANALFASYVNNDLGNIRFYDGAIPLYSWCEANCTNTTTKNAIFWVKLDKPIPQNSSLTIDMGVLPLLRSTEYDGFYAGEAPQSSINYGQYDNGANIFLAYANGNTPLNYFSVDSNEILSQATGLSYGSGKINALQLTGYATKGMDMVFTHTPFLNQPLVTESNFQTQTTLVPAGAVCINDNPSPLSSKNAEGVVMGYITYYFSQVYELNNVYTYTDSKGLGQVSNNWLFGSVTYRGPSSSTWNAYIAPQLYSTSGGFKGGLSSNNPLQQSGALYMCEIGSTVSFFPTTTYYNWIRARVDPPNDIMPATIFGNVITTRSN